MIQSSMTKRIHQKFQSNKGSEQKWIFIKKSGITTTTTLMWLAVSAQIVTFYILAQQKKLQPVPCYI